MIEPYQTAMADSAKSRALRAAQVCIFLESRAYHLSVLILMDQVVQNIDDITSRLSEASESIGALSKQAAAMETQLAHEKIGKRLVTALKKLFKLVDDEDGALVQLSVILGIGLQALRGDFGSLFKDTKQTQLFVDKVNALQASLWSCKTDLTTMTEAMKAGLNFNILMVDVWDNLAAKITNLSKHPSPDDRVTSSQKLSIIMNWEKTNGSADKAVALLTGALSVKSPTISAFNVSSFTTGPPPAMKFPQTSHEIKLLRMVADAGVEE